MKANPIVLTENELTEIVTRALSAPPFGLPILFSYPRWWVSPTKISLVKPA